MAVESGIPSVIESVDGTADQVRESRAEHKADGPGYQYAAAVLAVASDQHPDTEN